MNPPVDIVALLRRKRDGQRLEAEDWMALMAAVASGAAADEQVGALLMAVLWRGLDGEETVDLVRAMVATGETIHLPDVPGLVDKHSTGGVGDATTLVLAPWVVAAGGRIAKLSGRGLGHTGGTLDKLLSIPGFRVDLSPEEFARQLLAIGLVVAGQTPRMVPADRRLYAIRDVTATVDHPALIAASVMSKKIAGGAPAILLDVKVGTGAFVKTMEAAEELAQLMTDIGHRLGRRTRAVLTSMEEPLGRVVGNALEVAQAIRCLRGQGPEDLTALCRVLGAQMLALAGVVEEPDAGGRRLDEVLASGAALAMMRTWIEAQGGDPRVVDEPQRLLQPARTVSVPSPATGIVAAIDAELVGRAAMLLGAGRMHKEDPIDPAAGIRLHRKVGEHVRTGEPLMQLMGGVQAGFAPAAELCLAAVRIGQSMVMPAPLILGVIPSGTG